MAVAERLAADLHVGDRLLLVGDLGAGKSTLARAIVRSLAGGDAEVPSPSYTLVQAYEFAGLRLTHADLYRLHGPAEVAELGLEDAWADGVVLCEWAERAGPGFWPADSLWLALEGPFGDGSDRRRLTITGAGAWPVRLTGVFG